MEIPDEELADASSINIAACGTSWHSALTGKYMIERLARLPVDVDYASEYRYRNPIPDRNALGLAHHAVRRNRRHAGRATRDEGARIEDRGHLQRGGRHGGARGARRHLHARGTGDRRRFDQGVYCAVNGAVPARHEARASLRGRLDKEHSVAYIEELGRIPAKIEEVLRSRSAQCEALAKDFSTARDFLYLGRGIHFPDRARRRAEAQGDFVHSRRGLSGGRNEARAQRAHRRNAAGGGAGHARCGRSGVEAALREDALEYPGSDGAQRARDRGGDRGR